MMPRHLSATRPRYGRLVAAGVSMLVTTVAVLGGIGLVPASTAGQAPPFPSGAPGGAGGLSAYVVSTERFAEAAVALGAASTRLPADSGTGRRVVFDESAQRVWLVGADGAVLRTYLVSGSVHDNLEPGSYEVFSRSEHAVGIDESGTMQWFVRFARGARAAIGFHSIPVLDGRPLQSEAELGTPRSHGCIRQRTADARALWDFAPVGTTVVVTA